ncbi:hypothetical protein B7O87_11205 [Cylindrospermopsis raciborskii CENA303]|uniref:Uncharacterized protein n=1 Tax=Cylindrospermopsis raciborskii CENA303 TaxID=1170769 RepID=A0A1X4G5G2_9CYAN|nr:hypothetical protein [Cylindrospermopsis raciborskii]EFA71556.1 conserved hypothetical protein [Raphidiopsis brookii D9]OSO89715.1 hypothetical protein B7O87_11205 [Cylindrospermopsis raciborskii CENA303]
MNKNNIQNYRFVCTLTFGDIYGQIVAWLITITLSLASALALIGARRPVYALAAVGLVVVFTLPFLLFAFVTTLLNHIELNAVELETKTQTIADGVPVQKPIQANS